jgi:branched-subunit amino acid ABC-type transport system permease component
MKTLFTVCFIILSFSFNCFAEWALIPTDELVKESDLIVIGTLQSVSRYTKDNVDYSEGKIVVEKIISGNVKTTEGFPLKMGDKIKFKWQASTLIVCPRLDHSSNENEKGIWLLEVESDKTVSADYPRRFNSLNEMSELKKILRKTKVRKTSQRVELLNENPLNITNQQIQNSDTFQNQTIEPITIATVGSYSTFNALLVALFSLGLYWILYRSKFKIR